MRREVLTANIQICLDRPEIPQTKKEKEKKKPVEFEDDLRPVCLTMRADWESQGMRGRPGVSINLDLKPDETDPELARAAQVLYEHFKKLATKKLKEGGHTVVW